MAPSLVLQVREDLTAPMAIGRYMERYLRNEVRSALSRAAAART